jgi:Uma2 family endonuclease
MSDTAMAEQVDQGLAAARHKLTVSDFHRMAEAGILNDDDRVELIEGELFDMAPIGSKHAGIVAILTKLLAVGARDRCILFVQNPIRIADYNEPVPDLALLKPRADSYRDALPEPADVLLVIEVADSSIGRDRDVKIPLYARSRIPEAWLVDVQRGVVTTYRLAGPNGYASVVEVGSGTSSPQCLPDIAIDLSDLFG